MAQPDETGDIARRAPGVLSVAGKCAGSGIQYAIIGAALTVAASIGVALLSGQGAPGVMQFFQNTLGFQIGSGWMGLAATGCTVGALGGALLGIPAGGIAGISQMQHYYQDIALPEAYHQGEARGVQIGAHHEHEAMVHEAQARQYRTEIAQRSGSYAEEHKAAQHAPAPHQL